MMVKLEGIKLFLFLFCREAVCSFVQPSTSFELKYAVAPISSSTTLGVDNKMTNIIASTLVGAAALTFGSTVCRADELGVSNDAPTLLTGETVEICVKRGPLGKCEKTVRRTADNDNDKALTYMKAESEKVRNKDALMRASGDDNIDSPLILKLKQQTEDNKEKNERLIKQKTIENNLGASFGPLDRQVVILNTDGDSYTLLQNPQAMRLKKAGFIEGKKFVKQPTKEEMNAALIPSEEEEGGLLGSIIKSIGGSE
mmetsp:Transcript_12561/g.16388  ORF Transcript_12561/g.16388 Transcript_12561/m.16388 type:complete len:256 (-) Transcript_12561:485-1252(-)